MVELSHRPLRCLIERWGGCDLYTTEMASAGAWLANAAYEKWFLDTLPAPDRTVIQFYATNTQDIASAAARLRDELAGQDLPLAGVDINFGCSAPHIEKSGGGVAWMRQTEAAGRLVAITRAALPATPLSAKLRIGYEEDYGKLLDYCRVLVDAGLDRLTLHPRLKSEKFRRKSRWQHVAGLTRDLSIPVVGNGDIHSPKDYRKAMDSCQPAGIMLGREAIRRPWVFALIRGQALDPAFSLRVNLEETALAMLDLLRQWLPPVFHVSRARRFFQYFSENLAFGHHLRFRIQNADSLDTMAQLVKTYFTEVPQERIRLEF
ncbi:MAG: hypothetical protein A2087_13105 [Spirochaetes bacterium GWD1_61_31]|nr:MAG: hypothetical protein A2Y37_02510 [Spirochaetes bacterium GWB1_60_80]OHD28592.1 MAG: hypothetical protein A2004_03085 [Spirochaetes bacterium GWC1_61_12]OHD39508.1 MAG: hypothetical protein A2087_13105 [Spirochaetes bacterium GWD1_61_31]OHD45561.1 MAG: hypothetical protein A2Y35_02780 [Spirochaetes bacterium GWE1_60_18]OHD58133.1 MAG: hypothetical protein A2Y32_05355 [Spirochaetes bacterium GWF1_60_12]